MASISRLVARISRLVAQTSRLVVRRSIGEGLCMRLRRLLVQSVEGVRGFRDGAERRGGGNSMVSAVAMPAARSRVSRSRVLSTLLRGIYFLYHLVFLH